MSRVTLDDRTAQILDAIKQIVGAQGFTFNRDLSDTTIGRQNNEFRVIPTTAEISERSRAGILQPRQTFDIELFYNAESSTEAGLKRAMRTVTEVAHALDRFAPVAPLDQIRGVGGFVCGTFLINWRFETLNAGEDTRLKATIEFDVEYRIPRE